MTCLMRWIFVFCVLTCLIGEVISQRMHWILDQTVRLVGVCGSPVSQNLPYFKVSMFGSTGLGLAIFIRICF